ncbi:MAG: YvcK family protein [Ardenticatenales bacterium]|nr:YvcK family protein [Ardenticatenales bacterium]
MPGMQVKRWLALLLAGITAMALGIAYSLIDAYRDSALPGDIQPLLYVATLQFLPQAVRAILFLVIGLGMALGGLYGLNRSLLTAVAPEGSPALVDIVDRRRRRRSDAKIVAIGGGTGLSTLLRGLKQHTDQITAIVTVADDGGSSGRLRQSLGVHPPGDFRQCIAALANTEPLMQRLFEYRFGDGTELGGHAFGNLFIVAMTGITGSFESALRASSRVLAVRGRIVPSTLTHVTLFAELADDRVMAGESRVPHGEAPIRRVFLEPDAPAAYPEAVAAILDADLIILGPGSLYTSVLPNLLVPDIAAALEATRAPVVYVANVATQPGETDGYSLEDHVEALRRHLGRPVIDIVLANDNLAPLARNPNLPLVPPVLGASRNGYVPDLMRADLISDAQPTRHDPDRLAAAIARLLRDAGRRGGDSAA